MSSSFRDIWNNSIKCFNIYIIGVPEREEREEKQKYTSWNGGWKLSQSEKGNRHLSSRSTDGPKQDEPKAFS